MNVTAELLPLIKSINFHINSSIAENIHVTEVREDLVILEDKINSQTTNIKLSSSIYMQPNSLSGLSYEPNWLSFRVQLKDKSSVIDCVLSEINHQISSLQLGCDENDLLGRCVQLECNCGCPISLMTSFRKVCRLPSIETFLSAENWFCHAHGPQRELSASFRTSPGEDECFYDDLSFYVHYNILSVKTDHDHLICKKCSSQLGYKNQDTLRVWANDIKWTSHENVVFYKSATKILLTMLFNLEKGNLSAMPSLVLELNDSTTEYLYVIMIDSHLNLLNSTVTSAYNVCNEYSPLAKYQRLDDNCITLKKQKYVKVLYKYKCELDEESKTWINDINIPIIKCGSSIFRTIRKVLEKSTDYIPNSIRKVHNMNIGYVIKMI